MTSLQQITVFIIVFIVPFHPLKTTPLSILYVSADHVLRDTLVRGQWHTYLSRPGYRMPR